MSGATVIVDACPASVLLAGGDCDVVVVENERTQVVVAPGAQGPPGPPGPPGSAGGSGYVHVQSAALAVWTVPHNLGRYPSIAVVDHFGLLLTPDVQYIDQNIVQITHSVPTIGKAYCN